MHARENRNATFPRDRGWKSVRGVRLRPAQVPCLPIHLGRITVALRCSLQGIRA
jgi:hypothetical protein